jgi:uroporphyrinogen-III decarboxylase
MRAIRALGAYVKLPICGNMAHLLPASADLDVDILDVDHRVPLPAVRVTAGRKVGTTVNIDPVSRVHRGTPVRHLKTQCAPLSSGNRRSLSFFA